jgi:hypothetical protein
MTVVGRSLVHAAAALAAVLAATALAGCTAGGGDVPSPSATALPKGITVVFTQTRSDVAGRQAQIEFANGTDEVLHVGALQLHDPRFDGPAERVLDRTSTIAPGQVADIRIQLPPVACPGSDEAQSTVTVPFELGDVEGVATVPIDEKFPVLADLHARECLAVGVSKAAAVTLSSFTPSPPGEPADLVLDIAPTGDGPTARIGEVFETNLLSFEDPDAAAISYPIDLDITASSKPTTIHLPLVPARCDPHAVQEDKRGTVFDVSVEVDGAKGQMPLAASEDMRARILVWVTKWCEQG